MTTELLHHRLRLLGWKPLDESQQSDGCWCALATSCGHCILAFATTREEAWSAVSSMAMKLTREGLMND